MHISPCEAAHMETKSMQYFKLTVFLNLLSHMKNREWTLSYSDCEKVEVDIDFECVVSAV